MNSVYHRVRGVKRVKGARGINWEQVLKDLPDITKKTLKLDDLIQNPGFPRPEKVAV